MAKKLTYIDVFAGCGGLSLGLERAGFSLELAIEKSDMAAETFYHNFIKGISDQAEWEKFSALTTSVQDQAKTRLVVKELRAVLDCKNLLKELRDKDIDLLAGGPPCQGFSLAGRRNPNDTRNQLPWQFLEFVEAIRPKAVLIENVAGMRQNFVKHEEDAPFEQLRIALSETGAGYVVQPVLLNAMHFGVPQHRPRVMLIGIRKDIARPLGITATDETWKSDYDLDLKGVFSKRPQLAPKATHKGGDILSVRDALWDLSDKGYGANVHDQKYNKQEGSFARNARHGSIGRSMKVSPVNAETQVKNHNLRNHAATIILRFRLYQYMRDSKIPSKVLNVAAKTQGTYQRKALAVREFLLNAKFPAKAPDGYVLAKNIDDLTNLIIDLGTKKHSQRPLNWEAPSPTVVSLPDDFVHPAMPRTLTVRELARIQSFPDSFEFRAKETTGSLRRRVEVPQYTQVGNAVPPLLAEAVGNIFHDVLSHYTVDEKQANHKKAV